MLKSTYEPRAARAWYEANVKGATAATIDLSDKAGVMVEFEKQGTTFRAPLIDVCGYREAIARSFGRELWARELCAVVKRHTEVSNAIIMGAQESGGVTHADKFRCVIH